MGTTHIGDLADQMKRYNSDLRLFSYWLWKLAEERRRLVASASKTEEVEPGGLTLSEARASKTLANLLLDWGHLRKQGGPYASLCEPYAEWTPHNFGALVSFPRPVVSRRLYLSDIDNPEFWEIGEEGRLIVRPHSWEEVEMWSTQKLWCTRRDLDLGVELIRLYAPLTMNALNAIATSRTLETTVRSAKMELTIWARQHRRFVREFASFASTSYEIPRKQALERIHRAAQTARQMEKKVEDYRETVPDVMTQLREIGITWGISLAASVCQNVDHLQDPSLDTIYKVAQAIRNATTMVRLSLSVAELGQDRRRSKTKTIQDYAEILHALTNEAQFAQLGKVLGQAAQDKDYQLMAESYESVFGSLSSWASAILEGSCG